MRSVFIAILAMVLPAASALAEQPLATKPNKSAATARQLPPIGPGAGNSCAAYGPGFVKVESTETCVRIGGAVSVGVGGGR